MTEVLVKRIIEAFGFIAVVGSLIFVGLEVRQNSVAIRAETNASVANAFIQQNQMLASTPELAAAWARSAAIPEAASVEDALQLLGAWRAVFHIWSNAHRQHMNGTLDPVLFESVVQEISNYAGGQLNDGAHESVAHRIRMMRWAWQSERFVYNSEFQLFVDNLIDVED